MLGINLLMRLSKRLIISSNSNDFVVVLIFSIHYLIELLSHIKIHPPIKKTIIITLTTLHKKIKKKPYAKPKRQKPKNSNR